MTKATQRKEHREHQAALKPLLKHLHSDEVKLGREKKMKHHLTHSEEVKGGKDSHMHHKKMHDHHMKEAKKHADHLHKIAKANHKKEHITAHDKAVDRKNLTKARHAK